MSSGRRPESSTLRRVRSTPRYRPINSSSSSKPISRSSLTDGRVCTSMGTSSKNAENRSGSPDIARSTSSSNSLLPTWYAIATILIVILARPGHRIVERFRMKQLFAALMLIVASGCGLPSFLVTPVQTPNELQEFTVEKGSGWSAPKVAIIEVSGMILNAKGGSLLQPGENKVSLFEQELERA